MNFKKALILIVPPLLFALQTILSVTEVRDYLNLSDPQTITTISGIIFALFIINYIFERLSPYAKFARFEETKNILIENQVESIVKNMKKHGLDIRINIMLKKRLFLSTLEPSKYFKLFSRRVCFMKSHLDVYWVSRNMDHASDRAIRLTIDQGLAGMVCKLGEARLAIFDVSDSESYNLNESQFEKTKNLKVLYSFPINIYSRHKRLGSSIIGTINVDSRDGKTAELLNNNEETLKQLIEEIQSLSETCSLFL